MAAFLNTVYSMHCYKPKQSVSTRTVNLYIRMWAGAQRDGRPTEYGWRPLLNAAKFG